MIQESFYEQRQAIIDELWEICWRASEHNDIERTINEIEKITPLVSKLKHGNNEQEFNSLLNKIKRNGNE